MSNGYNNSCIHSDSNDYSGGNTVWYNYAIASAETITGDNNTNTTTESVCPKGWTLPYKVQVDNQKDKANFSTVYGGAYYKADLVNETTVGYWWGNEATTGVQRYYLRNNQASSSLSTGIDYRDRGFYIRCVSEEKTVLDLTYMQDMTPSIADWTADGTTATLTDRRDGKLYTVAKINGNMWMTQNLRFGYDATNASATDGVSSLTLDPSGSDIVLDATRTNPTSGNDEVTDGYRELTTYDLVSHGKNTSGTNQCYGASIENDTTVIGWGPGYQYGCIHSGLIKTSGDIATTWYNYVLASAGTIIDENTTKENPASNADTATESICPKGWSLPNGAQIRSIGPTAGSTVYVPIFFPVLGGNYTNSALNVEDAYGFWWGSEAPRTTKPGWRITLRYYTTNNLLTYNNFTRYRGQHIRCVQKS